jgi:hypothetical protein
MTQSLDLTVIASTCKVRGNLLETAGLLRSARNDNPYCLIYLTINE